MIISRLTNAAPPVPVPEIARPPQIYPAVSGHWIRSNSGKMVTEETAKRIATAYRCANILSDDVAMMPFQVFHRMSSTISRIYPDPIKRNHAFLLERQPNRWMTPFLFKKTVINWLLFWGNAYIWAPVGPYPELFILPASNTYPVLDQAGNLWYSTTFPNNTNEMIPDVEMVHLMINSADGFTGRSVLSFARDTFGRQIGAHETQDEISGNGLNPTAAIWTSGELSKDAREAVKKSYLDASQGGVVIFDTKISKFESLTMKPTDAQFLETVLATDSDIANFFGMPLYKVNLGKQSYESNEQQDLEYLKSTLNQYLVQWEQAANLKWISEADQPFVYTKFNRDALLQTDAKTRTEVLTARVQSGLMSPNEARGVEDMSGYTGGDAKYMSAQLGMIQPDGTILTGNTNGQAAGQGAA